MLENIRIILVNTSHPGNIGAAARAMKTMGLSQLVLVEPKTFPSGDATAMASNADDLLAKACVVPTLAEALVGAQLVIGASARNRDVPMPVLTAREAGEKAVAESSQTQIALVFGRENSGLTIEEMQQCHFHLSIPGNPDYNVLNLAQAVQIVCYEIWQAKIGGAVPAQAPHDAYAAAEDVERYYQHLEKVLVRINFLDPENPRRLMQRIRRLYNRYRLEKKELGFLRGILTATEQALKESDLSNS